MNIGDYVPSSSFEMTDGKLYTFDKFKGKRVVLYFYPKDDTPGCTLEAQAFRDHLPAFTDRNTVVLGVSKDNLKSHVSFREKHCLPFELIVDTDASHLAEDFGVWVEKSMYGKKYFGIERSTFLISPEGKIEHVWRKVSPKGHVEAVLERIIQD